MVLILLIICKRIVNVMREEDISSFVSLDVFVFELDVFWRWLIKVG